MDADRFDTLSRLLHDPHSRRSAFASLLGGTLSLLALAETAAKKNGNGKNDKKKVCPNSKPDRCGEKCCKTSQTCKKGKCIHHCNDKKTNFGETDFDCGGTCRDIRRCGLGALCKEDADCNTNVCVSRPDLRTDGNVCLFCREDSDCARNDPQGLRCLINMCFHCSRDADCPRPGQPREQDKCIEPVNGTCPSGRPCACGQCRIGADCEQGQFCDETGSCISCSSPKSQSGQVHAAQCNETCTNGIQDGDETDEDCGGSCPTKCLADRNCAVGGDCQSGICNAQGRCQCASDDECAAAFPEFLPICLDGRCTECREASDCPDGLSCEITDRGGQCR